MHAENPRDEAQAAGVFPACSLPKALPYGSPSNRTIALGDYTHILDEGVAKSALV
jgi:hypothetical protein